VRQAIHNVQAQATHCISSQSNVSWLKDHMTASLKWCCCCAAVAAEHAELQQKGKQVFLKALQGESVFDR
jgi:hypothetical protein